MNNIIHIIRHTARAATVLLILGTGKENQVLINIFTRLS